MHPRAKSFAISTAVVGTAAMVATGFVAEDRIRDEYYLWKLEKGDEGEQVLAVEKLGGTRSARAVSGLVSAFRMEAKKVAAHLVEETILRQDLKRHVELWCRLRNAVIEVGKPATMDLLQGAADEDDLGVAMCLVRALLEIHGYPTSEGNPWSRSRPVYPGEPVLRKLRDDTSNPDDTRQLAFEVLKTWFSG